VGNDSKVRRTKGLDQRPGEVLYPVATSSTRIELSLLHISRACQCQERKSLTARERQLDAIVTGLSRLSPSSCREYQMASFHHPYRIVSYCLVSSRIASMRKPRLGCCRLRAQSSPASHFGGTHPGRRMSHQLPRDEPRLDSSWDAICVLASCVARVFGSDWIEARPAKRRFGALPSKKVKTYPLRFISDPAATRRHGHTAQLRSFPPSF
jgi:hypothetical protein